MATTHLVYAQLWLIPLRYLITLHSSSLKSSAQIQFDAQSSKLRQGEHTTTQALIFLTPLQAFIQNSQLVLTTFVMACISIDFQSSFSGDFQQRNLLSRERQTNFGCGSRVLIECLRKRKPLRMWVSTSPMDSLYELQSLLRLVGEEDTLVNERLEPLIQSMATMSSCFILPILAVLAFDFVSVDFILNISRQLYETSKHSGQFVKILTSDQSLTTYKKVQLRQRIMITLSCWIWWMLINKTVQIICFLILTSFLLF